MHSRAPAAAQRHRLPQTLPVKIPGKGSHAEVAARQIDGVGPVGQRHLQPLPVPGGGQKLKGHSITSLSEGGPAGISPPAPLCLFGYPF
jgi:hypothetical protein